MKRARWYLGVVLGPLLCLQATCLIYYVREQAFLSAYLNAVTSAALPPSRQVEELVLSLKNKPDNGNDFYFLSPLFRSLRQTPRQVIENGGDCADRSRVVVALLRLRGIHASKWSLYDAQGEPRHAVVQADTEVGKMVVDPLFGMWFPKPNGGYYAIRDLKRDPLIVHQRIKELQAEGQEPGADRLEGYPLDKYIYINARTINWNKSRVFRASYRILRSIFGESVDNLPRPSLAEEPALMVFYAMVGLEVVIILGWLMAARLCKWATDRTRSGDYHWAKSKSANLSGEALSGD